MKKIISVILALITAASLASFGVLASDSAEGILGDGNRDGKINVKDIVIAIRAAIGQTMDNIDLDALDINRDGNVDVKDISSATRPDTSKATSSVTRCLRFPPQSRQLRSSQVWSLSPIRAA